MKKVPLPALSVLVLTEDSAADAHDTLVALLKKTFRLVSAECGTHRIRFDPQSEPEKRYAVANQWKGDGPQDKGSRARASFRLVDLYRTIATRILEQEPPGFVLFHFDGDRRWSERDQSENAASWEIRVRDKVRAVLVQHGLADTEIERAMQRLHPLTPFYSIEAWTYQNFAEAERICAELRSPALAAQLASWKADRATLDEILQLKDACDFGGRHNRRLAEASWPAEAVHAVGASFAAAIDALRASPELTRVLSTT